MIITTDPAEVIRYHAALTDRFRHPSVALADFIAYHMRLGIKHARERRWGDGRGDYGTAMFWPVLPREAAPRDVTSDHGMEFARLIGRGLADAVTYEVTAEMVTAMRGVYANTKGTVTRIDEREMPCPAGFAWLDESWTIGEDNLAFKIRALSWEFMDFWGDNDGQPGQWPCARFALWRHDLDVEDPADRGELHKLGPMVLTHSAPMPFDLEFSKPIGEELSSTDSFLGLVHLLWMFLGMEIVAAPRANLHRQARRHALRSLKHGEVHVVVLRRIAHPSGEEAGHREVDWQCRWPVQGHYRHAHHPAYLHRAVKTRDITERGNPVCVCGDELFWVAPYLKGPDGLPLKVSKTLMKLAR